MSRRFRLLVASAATAVVLPLAACGTGGTGGTGSGDSVSTGGGDRLTVVASTDVYGDLAATIGGDAVEVTSLISGPDKDPHSYESTVRDSLAVSKADLVVLNGGGYDTFMTSLVDKNEVEADHVVDAVATSGLDPDEATPAGASSSADEHAEGGSQDGHDHGEFNEHVWYSLPTAEKVVTAIKDKFTAARPADARTFEANAAALNGKLDALEQRLTALKTGTAASDGASTAAASGAADGATTDGSDGASEDVAITEPVPLYLLADAGLHNVTPASFSEAIEEGGDVSPADLNTMKTLMTGRKVAFLAYNTQSESPQTSAVASAAKTAGVPVVDFTETLPEGKHYADWMADNISAVESALRSAR